MRYFAPTRGQFAFLRWEFGLFFHFGIRSFYPGHRDWDGVFMDPARFRPKDLDCRRWADTAVKAGAKYAIMTAKHHDGFALWNTKTTDYGVRNTNWRQGNGDVVREFTDACREFGLGVGLYYSPAEFGSREKSAKDYDAYFLSQITELLTRYGKIDYLWFDGCGADGHDFDRQRITKEIRRLQPDILLFNLWDPDVLWVGNEDGIAPENLDPAPEPEDGNDALARGRRFQPYECDCKLRPCNWFWTPTDEGDVRDVNGVMGLYDLSVGHGANLLLNVGPDDRGLIPEKDASVLEAFGKALKNRFASPLPVRVWQEGGDVFVAPEGNGRTSANTLVLEENLTAGETAGAWRLYVRIGDRDFLLTSGTRVGHKRIVTLPDVLLGDGRDLRLAFDGGEAPPLKINLYHTEATV